MKNDVRFYIFSIVLTETGYSLQKKHLWLIKHLMPSFMHDSCQSLLTAQINCILMSK